MANVTMSLKDFLGIARETEGWVNAHELNLMVDISGIPQDKMVDILMLFLSWEYEPGVEAVLAKDFDLDQERTGETPLQCARRMEREDFAQMIERKMQQYNAMQARLSAKK